MFSPDHSTLEGAVDSTFKDVFPIPLFGSPVLNAINNAFGFKTITKNDEKVLAKYLGIANNLASGVSLGANVADIVGRMTDLISGAGNIATVITALIAGYNVRNELKKYVKSLMVE